MTSRIHVMVVLATMSASAVIVGQGVTVTARSLTDLRAHTQVSSEVEDTLSANTDVTGGLHLDASQSFPFSNSATADVNLSIERSSDRIAVRLAEYAGVSTTSGAVSASIGPHQIRIELQSSRPIGARLAVRNEVTGLGTQSQVSSSGRASVAGHGSVDAAVPFFPVEQTFDVIVDAGGLVVDFETEAAASLAARGGIAFVSSTWELELVPDPTFPCEIESYGETCGAMLSAGADLDRPGEVVLTLQDPSLPDVAALTLGSTRASTPIIGTGCTLYHNLQVFLFPWPVDSSGRAEVSFVVPPIPGLSFKMQAATLKGTTIHATNALDALVCH